MDFNDLFESDLVPPEVGVHPSGQRLHMPSTRYETKYECVRCSKVRGGPRMTAVHYNTRIGVCAYCASDDERAAALRLPSALTMRPVTMKKQSLGRQVADLLMTTAQIHPTESDVVICPVCKLEAAGGLVKGLMNTTTRKCGLCRAEEEKQVRLSLKID